MNSPLLRFSDAERIGRVAGVDTSRVLVEIEEHTLMSRLTVSNLVAVQGATATEFLIGMVDRVVRTTRQEVLLDEEDDAGVIPVGQAESDTVRMVLVGTYLAVDGDRRNVFKRGADAFPQIERTCYLIEAGNLQRLMSLLGADIPEAERLTLGSFVTDRSATAIADGNRFFQRHASLLGSTGSGKSWAVALILQRASALRFPNLIVFDVHGEYTPLSAGRDDVPGFAAGYHLAGPGDLESPRPGALFLPYWVLNHEEMLALLLDRTDFNAPNQASRFSTHVRALKEQTLKEQGQEATRRTFTVDSPIPYRINDLLTRLKADDEEMIPGAKAGSEKAGPYNGKLTRFIARLEARVSDRRYGFLFQPPEVSLLYNWLGEQVARFLDSSDTRPGIKIVDFSEVPSDVLPIVTGVFARVIYDVQFWLDEASRAPVAFVCDEAHQYLPVREGLDAAESRAVEVFERIAKEGRKYGVSLLVVSQRPADVNRTILSQCNNFLILRLTNEQDQNVVRRLMPDSMAGLTEMLPLLDVGEAFLIGDSVLLPARIRLEAPVIKPSSATREFWTEWGSKQPNVDLIRQAVECLRRQVRANEGIL
jgi:hypothetical protein